MELTKKLKEDIKSHAISVSPEECCGVVVLFKGKPKYIRCTNIHPLPTHEFYIKPEDIISAEYVGDVVAIVHSHAIPEANEDFSEADRIAQAESETPWILYNAISDKFYQLSDGVKPSLYGREYKHGITDCYSFVRDFYQQELGIILTNFAREDEWWNKGQNMYVDNYEAEGFRRIELKDVQYGDLFIMCLGSKVPNHGAIYLGENRVGHHACNRLSCIDIYGNFLRDRTALVLRHKEMDKKYAENN